MAIPAVVIGRGQWDGLKFSKSSSCSTVKQLITKCLYHTTRVNQVNFIWHKQNSPQFATNWSMAIPAVVIGRGQWDGLKFSKSSSCSTVKQLITKCLYHTTRVNQVNFIWHKQNSPLPPPPTPSPLPGDFDNRTSHQFVHFAVQTDLWIGYDVHVYVGRTRI